MKLALFLMRFMQMPLLPLFVFLKVLTGKWESSPAGRGPVPTHRWGEGGCVAMPVLGGPQGSRPLWPSRLAHPPSPISPRYTLIYVGRSSQQAHLLLNGEAVLGGEAGSLGEHGSLISSENEGPPSVRTTVVAAFR